MNLMNLFCLLCFTFLDGWKSCRDGERLEGGKTQLLRWTRQDFTNREFKIPRRRQLRKRRLKSEFAIFQPLSRLLKLVYFVKCKRTLFLSRIPKNHIQVQKERKFSRRLFTSLIKLEIRHFPVAVVQWRQRNVQKSTCRVVVLPVQPIAFFGVPVVVTVVAS